MWLREHNAPVVKSPTSPCQCFIGGEWYDELEQVGTAVKLLFLAGRAVPDGPECVRVA